MVLLRSVSKGNAKILVGLLQTPLIENDSNAVEEKIVSSILIYLCSILLNSGLPLPHEA